MISTIATPLSMLKIKEFGDLEAEYVLQAEHTAAQGWAESKELIKERIIEHTRSYILEKAQALGANLEVEVELSDDDIPIPVAVSMIGKVSPYAKRSLTKIITEDLGIEKEKLTWI